MNINDYYKILGLEAGADKEVIKKSYRRLAKIYHPDLNRSPDAHEKFIEISRAYEILINLDTRYIIPEFEEKSEAKQEWAKYYAKARTEAREKARRYARMRYEKLQKEHEAFRTSGIYDLVLFLRYFLRVLAFPLLILFILLPIISDKVSEHPSGIIFIWLLAGMILFFIINNWKTYFKLGEFYYSLEDIINIIKIPTYKTTTKCYYCKGQIANSKPYKITLIKIRGLGFKDNGALYGRQAQYKSTYKKILIPRSRKAFMIHRISALIKFISIILLILFLNINNSLLRFTLSILGAGIISSFFLYLAKTRSRVSYLLSYSMLIRILIWSTFIILLKEVGVIGFLLLDYMLDYFILLPKNNILLKPLIKQHHDVENCFDKKYKLCMGALFYSSFYPFFKWLL